MLTMEGLAYRDAPPPRPRRLTDGTIRISIMQNRLIRVSNFLAKYLRHSPRQTWADPPAWRVGGGR